MERRELLRLSAVAAVAPIVSYVRPRPDRSARVVWLAYCAGEEKNSSLPQLVDFCRDQEARGRKIIGTQRSANQSTFALVAEEFSTTAEAIARQEQMFRLCWDSYEKAEAEFGSIFAIAALGADESFDVPAFMGQIERVSLDRLWAKVHALERGPARGPNDPLYGPCTNEL